MSNILLVNVILLLSHEVSCNTDDTYIAFNSWTEEADALNLLEVESHSEPSRIQCCARCSRDARCFGAAWNKETEECQMASERDAVAYVDLTAVANWNFMVN